VTTTEHEETDEETPEAEQEEEQEEDLLDMELSPDFRDMLNTCLSVKFCKDDESFNFEELITL
jgi:hypothetical protein